MIMPFPDAGIDKRGGCLRLMEKSNKKISKELSKGEGVWLKGMPWQPSASKTLLAALVFFALGFLIYSNTFENPFVFDDVKRILDNADIRMNELTAENISDAAFGKKSARNRPVGNISFALNYYFHQYRLKGYHIVNIIIHILTGICLFTFIKTTLTLPAVKSGIQRPETIALFAAVIWLIHPVQTQSVTYIVQRLNSLSAMFYLFSFLFYLKGRLAERKAHSRAWFIGAGLGWILALGCKQNAATLPFIIYLYEWYFFQNLSKTWLRKSVKYLLVVFILFGLIAFIFLGPEPWEKVKNMPDFSEGQFTMGQRILTQSRVVIYYLSLLFYPHPSRLNLDYDFALSYSLINPLTTLFSLTAIIGLVVLGVYLAKKERLISFCIFWFFGNLVIESTVIPLAIIFEHRLYLPCMLVFLMPIGLCLRYIRFTWLRSALICLVVVVLCVWTYQRNKVWENELTLWTDVVSKSPNKARPLIDLGLALADRDRLDEAIQYLLKSLQIDPNHAEAHNNLGYAFAKQGKENEAIKHYRKALEITPMFPDALSNLGNALSREGKTNEAIAYYRMALQIDSNDDTVHSNLGVALSVEGEAKEAIEHFRKALQLNPHNDKAYNNLGRLLAEQNMSAEAIRHYRLGLQINPKSAEAHNNLGLILQKQGNTHEAVEHFRKVIELNPDNDKAHNNLGLALAAQGNSNGAIKHYRTALQINPDYAETHNNLGGELLKQGRTDEALVHFTAALRLNPGMEQAHSNMGVLLLQKGKIEAAIFHLREAVRLKPDFSQANDNLKKALALQMQMENRMEKIQAALGNNPDNPALYFELGNIFLGRGEFSKAIAEFEKALFIQPQFAPAQYNLALAHAAGGQYDRALEAFKKMTALEPDNPNTYYNIAAMYALQDNVPDSIAWLRKAIDRGYQNWELIKTDKDLENIRSSAAYQDLVKNH
jgi:tetratricopeptide (TPR) repeat protein